jgi:hypothetical protein
MPIVERAHCRCHRSSIGSALPLRDLVVRKPKVDYQRHDSERHEETHRRENERLAAFGFPLTGSHQ